MRETGRNELCGTAGDRDLRVYQRRLLESTFLAGFEQQLENLSGEL